LAVAGNVAPTPDFEDLHIDRVLLSHQKLRFGVSSVSRAREPLKLSRLQLPKVFQTIIRTVL
jgi:hypothetical protein